MSEAYRILITAPYFLPVLERFRDRLEAAGCELVPYPVTERAGEEELLTRIAGIDGVICGDDAFTRRVVEATDRLKVIAKWGTGIDSIDTGACAERGIAVLNTPDAFSLPVADTVLGYALIFARRLLETDRAMQAGEWSKQSAAALSEWTFGIVGVGNIGRQVARRAATFGPRLLGTDIVEIDAGLRAETGLEAVELTQLLETSDVVSLNCDLNPTSRHLVRTATLELMKPGAVLINTARGAVVKESDLVAALDSGRLGGAALDVFEVEPLPADSPLRGRPNVLLGPHNANSSPRAWEAVHENTVTNLLQGLAGAE